MKPLLRLVFMGTPELAAVCLRELASSGLAEICAVVSQPDRPKGRNLQLLPTPVKETARQLGLPLLQPERAREPAFLSEITRMAPDIIVVAAYGQILPPALLQIPRLGCLNVHTSLLPKFRGAAPIQRAILEGERETGVTIMKMDEGMDTGGILTQERTIIEPGDDAATLHDRLAGMGAKLLVTTLPDYAEERIQPRPQQTSLATYAPKIKKEDGRIDWNKSARQIFNQVRGLVPWPVAFTSVPLPAGAITLKIWTAEEAAGSHAEPGVVVAVSRKDLQVACGEGSLNLLAVQREGGKKLKVAEFLAGTPIRSGLKLG